MLSSMSGLRESKRAHTRAALASAAFDLVRERGLAAVTVDDIVATVPVSRRTFSNYFTSKEEAVAAVITERARAGLETWMPPSVGDNVVELVPSLVAHQVGSGVLEVVREVAALARKHPALLPHWQAAQWSAWLLVGDRLRAVEGADAASGVEVAALLGALHGIASQLVLAPTTNLDVLGLVRRLVEVVHQWAREG